VFCAAALNLAIFLEDIAQAAELGAIYFYLRTLSPHFFQRLFMFEQNRNL
jgi:hypothetical protein